MSSMLISLNNNLSSALFEISQSMEQNIFSYRVVGYSPAKAPAGSSSLMDTSGNKKIMSPSSRHVVVPKGAIIDRIEFAGFNDFSAGRFEIGLGPFNSVINFPLIIGATSDVANEPIGGIRDFKFDDPSGTNEFAMVAQDSYININTTNAMTGDLQVIIYFHLRPPMSV